MKQRVWLASIATLMVVIGCTSGSGGAVPEDSSEIELTEKLRQGLLHPVDRTATALAGEEGAVELDERSGQGLVWVDDVVLTDGVIQVELRGRDVPGGSFVGLAFHGVNDTTYEAVYVRSFNFRSDQPQRRAHGLQYISHPEHTWRSLRASNPGRYEAELVPAPDPSDWLRLRLEIEHPTLRIFAGGSSEPVLVVDQLGRQKEGRVGLWVGNDSNGAYRNLRVRSAPAIDP